VFAPLRRAVRDTEKNVRSVPWRSVTEVVRLLFRWLGSHEIGLILSLVGLSVGTYVFAELVSELREGELQSVDNTLLLMLRERGNPADPLGPAWLEESGRDISALGGAFVLTLLGLAAVGYLLLLRKQRAALLIAASLLGALGLSLTLKSFFDRARPSLVPHLSHTFTSSFPSGHSMLSTAVFLTLGALLARLEQRRIVKAYFLLWALFLAVLVGISRVYVGVHWPTDVLAGWAAGAAWASFSWVVARWLQRRGVLEG
jgi:undecaprenyl-diphosphatase